ncbi:MAG: glutathione synthase, partial [Dechloromonas sp.]|nr:glutathione synthase [Dechloromonas sp.]
MSPEPPDSGRRPLNLAFVLDPLPRLKAYKDSSIAMMRAAAARGHAVFAIDCATLGWRRPQSAKPGGVFGVAMQLHMQPDNHDWFREIGRERIPLGEFDAVLMRRDPPF